jgi:hypothetical protein
MQLSQTHLEYNHNQAQTYIQNKQKLNGKARIKLNSTTQ